jgi:hypothetical protein
MCCAALAVWRWGFARDPVVAELESLGCGCEVQIVKATNRLRANNVFDVGVTLPRSQDADAARVLSAVSAAANGYRELGTVLDYPLLTAEHAAIVEAARRVGGAAKPSGAGGGDLAVALLPGDAAAQAFAAALPADLSLLPLQISARGIHFIAGAAACAT